MLRSQFTTYQHDNDDGTDLDYAMARYYASRSGRFMTPDPGHIGANVGDPQSWNAYAYSRNDPVNLVDPTGTVYVFCNDNSDGNKNFMCMNVADKDLSLYIGGTNDFRSPYSLTGDWWKADARGLVLEGGVRPVGSYWHKSVDGPAVRSEAGILDYAESLLKQINPFNADASVHQSLVSIKESAVGMVTLDSERIANAWDNGPLGQTANTTGIPYYGTRAALVGAGAAATAAALLLGAEIAGITDIGQTQIAWKGAFQGGEITFTRLGKTTADFRINPFGGSGYPPHYHRRPGIGKHRPWDGGW